MFNFQHTRNAAGRAAACGLAMGLVLTMALSALAGDKEAEIRIQKAREALNASRFERAAELYSQIYETSQEDIEAGNALYWEAFARYRLNKTSELKKAARLLSLQQERYAETAMALEGQALSARIAGELAERGEAEAVREITGLASEADVRQETRLAALQSLLRMDRARAMPVLTKIIRDDSAKNRELRRNAVFMMCHEDDQETENLLIEILKKETDPDFQAELVMCLSSTGSPRALDAMLDLYHNTKDPQVALTIISSVGHIDGDRAFDFLLEAARDKKAGAETRGYALHSLTMTDRDDEVTDVLIDIVGSETDIETLQAAIGALHRLDNPKANQALLEIVGRPGADDEVRALALYFAASNGVVDLGQLKKIYDGSNSREMKLQICHILTQLDQEDESLDMLIEIAREEKDPEIRRDAVFWIGRFESDRAAEYLLEVINQE